MDYSFRGKAIVSELKISRREAKRGSPPKTENPEQLCAGQIVNDH